MNADKIAQLISCEHRRQALKLSLDEIEREEDEIKAEVMAEMTENEMGVFENDEVRIKYVSPVIRETLDTYRIKKEHPEIAKDCIKQVEQKATLKITLKGE